MTPTSTLTVIPLDLDRRIRAAMYASFATHGRAPAVAQLAATLGAAAQEIAAALARLHDAHALVLDRATGEVRMALPFSNVETAYLVEAGERAWSANCAWDALAIPRLLRLADARIVDRGGPDRPGAVRSVARGELVERDGVVSFPLPARRWWDDIVFT